MTATWCRALVLLGGVLGLPLSVAGQNPAAVPRPAPRRNIPVLTLSSSAFGDGETMPQRHAQPGRDVSPPLAWSGVPDSIASFVLVVHDVDAAAGNGTDDVLHWLVWNIPGTARGLTEGVPADAQLPDGARQISVSGPYFRGPAAPSSGPPHHYVFELFALDVMLDVPAVGASPAATRASVMSAMAGHVRGKGALVARYRRNP
jgi:Raf kinase inhibitor-like YbhB/YbcL family protein